MHVKISSAKWRPFCPWGDELTPWNLNKMARHFVDNIFKFIFLTENFYVFIHISLKFVLKGSLNNKPALVQITAWRHTAEKLLPEPTMIKFTCIVVIVSWYTNQDQCRIHWGYSIRCCNYAQLFRKTPRYMYAINCIKILVLLHQYFQCHFSIWGYCVDLLSPFQNILLYIYMVHYPLKWPHILWI